MQAFIRGQPRHSSLRGLLINLGVVEPIARSKNLSADLYFFHLRGVEHEEAETKPFAYGVGEWFYFIAWLPDVFTQT